MSGWLEDHWVQEMQCSGSDAVLFQTPLLIPQQMNFIWRTRQSRQKLNCCLLFSIPMAWEKWVRDQFLHYLQHFCPTGILPRVMWFSRFYGRLWRIITNLIYQMRNYHLDSTQISVNSKYIYVSTLLLEHHPSGHCRTVCLGSKLKWVVSYTALGKELLVPII